MNGGRLVGVAVIAAAIAGGVGAWLFARESAAASGTWAALQAQRADRERELARLEARVPADQAEAAKVKAAWEALAKRTPPRPEVRPAAPEATPLRLSDLIKKSSTPDNQTEADARWLTMVRGVTRNRYTPLFRSQALDAGQQAAFTENVMKRDAQNRDLSEAAQARGYGINDPAISKLRGEIFVEYEAAQRALLGDAGYGTLVEFDRTSGLREVVSNLAGAAALSGEALTPAQTEALLHTIAEASSSYRRNGYAQWSGLDWARLRAQLPTVLSPAQVVVFSTMEPPGAAGGLHHAEWNSVMAATTKAEAAGKAGGKN